MDILVWVIVVLFTYALIRSTFSILGFSKPKNLPPQSRPRKLLKKFRPRARKRIGPKIMVKGK
ncbi:hypothetical protein Hanom_Chr03g00216951 [Helianthus anomalus]